MMPLDSDIQRYHQTEPVQILQKDVGIVKETVNCIEKLCSAYLRLMALPVVVVVVVAAVTVDPGVSG